MARKNGKNTKEYQVWHSMLGRCYSFSRLEKFPTYKDCTVDEHWHCFQNFAEDIQYLEGYNEWKKDSFNFHLDKDIKIIGNRIYSKDTCIFAPKEKNLSKLYKKDNGLGKLNITGLTYLAIRLSDNHIETFKNQLEFSKKFNLNACSINNCLHNRQKTHRGWRFEII